ncbi:MAG TPA: hypothetical protein VJ577_16295 [Burkholderiaceae bacterium]|nr:hypothetical protein [Burkholderiaceae bacterium]
MLSSCQLLSHAPKAALYGRHVALVEQVFGNLCGNKCMVRFTWRSQRKVDTQWKLYGNPPIVEAAW